MSQYRCRGKRQSPAQNKITIRRDPIMAMTINEVAQSVKLRQNRI